MSFESGLIFLVSYIIMHIKPGPGQAFRVSCALDKGFGCAMAVSVGVAVSCTFYFLLVAFGYNTLIDHFDSLSYFLKLFGGTYLIYLGVSGLLKQGAAPSSQAVEKPVGRDLLKYFFLGLMISLSNPIDIFYFASILPSLVSVGELSSQGVMWGASVVLFTGVIIDVLNLTVVIQAKKSILDVSVVKYINWVASISFILIGLFLFYIAFFPDDFSFDVVMR